MADEPKAETSPEITDIDGTYKLLQIAHHASNDPALRATYSAARAQLGKINKTLQDHVDKQRADAAKAQEAADAKAAEDAKMAKRKAEDEAAAKAAQPA